MEIGLRGGWAELHDGSLQIPRTTTVTKILLYVLCEFVVSTQGECSRQEWRREEVDLETRVEGVIGYANLFAGRERERANPRSRECELLESKESDVFREHYSKHRGEHGDGQRWSRVEMTSGCCGTKTIERGVVME